MPRTKPKKQATPEPGASPVRAPPKRTEPPHIEFDSEPEVLSGPTTPEPESPKEPKTIKKPKYSENQLKLVSDVIKKRVNINLIHSMPKKEIYMLKRTALKEPITEIYYRLAYSHYNDFDLLNIVRFWPDWSKRTNQKSYATIRLDTIETTLNSQHSIEFTDEDVVTIKKVLGISI